MSQASPPRTRHPWEASYPPGADWSAPIATSTLPDLLDRAVARFGDAPALRFRLTRLSYAELGRRVDRLAAGLIAEGLRPRQPVALYLSNSPTHPIAFFAILRAGGVVVNLSPLDPPRALARKLADSGASWLISSDTPGLLPTAKRLAEEGHAARVFIAIEDAWAGEPSLGLPDGEPLHDWPAISEQNAALLQYTGGTTGHPKAVMLSHANLTAAVSIYRSWNEAVGLALGPKDRVALALPVFHIYALVVVILRGLSCGVELLIEQRFDAKRLVDVIETERVTVFNGVPTMFQALVQLPGIEHRDLSSLMRVSCGGAPLPVEIARRLEALTGHRVGGGWGMTETAPAGTNLLPGSPPAPGAIGLPLPGIEMQVVALDDPRRVLPPGETGELRIRGPNVTKGYWNRPDENARAFVDGFFLTGDAGYMDAGGHFFLIDRKKDMIISAGYNVYPRVIEDAIYEHPDVIEAGVIGIADDYRGQSAKAFIAQRPGSVVLTLDVLRQFLAERIGRHELPTALELRDELPKTPAGKISRLHLAHPPAQEP